MRMKIRNVIRAARRRILVLLEVQIPWGAVAGLRTR